MRLTAFCFLMLFVSLTLVAQSGSPEHATISQEYVLGPGDQIVIHVIDIEEIPDRPFRVSSNGDIDVPLAGTIHVGGLTLDRFKTELAKRLSRYINSPQITINLSEEQSRSISVIGAVNAPGIHELPRQERLIEVLSLAGGVKPEAGWSVIVTRDQKWGPIPVSNATVDAATGNSTVSIPLDALLSSRKPTDNILIYPGDIISVPKAEVVYVVGDVKKAGGFQLSSHPTISVLQALSLAEGLDRDASPTHAKILRDGLSESGQPKEIPVDISQIFSGKAPDIPLQGNDVLFVPNSSAKSGSRRAVDAILQAATGVAIYRF